MGLYPVELRPPRDVMSVSYGMGGEVLFFVGTLMGNCLPGCATSTSVGLLP